MKILFMLFMLFLLLLAELSVGRCGFYLPLAWLGVFYFACVKCRRKILFCISMLMALVVDGLLLHRVLMPDVFIGIGVFYFALKCGDDRRISAWRSSFLAVPIIITAYILQYAASLYGMPFSWGGALDFSAMMITFLPIGCLIFFVMILFFEFLQKKMKFEMCFIDGGSSENGIYRRNTERKMR